MWSAYHYSERIERTMLMQTIDFLRKRGELTEIKREVDPYLEAAAIHLETFRSGGPAVFFHKIKGSKFPAVSNLFGTEKRSLMLFEKTLSSVEHLVALKANPLHALKHPLKTIQTGFAALRALPLPAFYKGVCQNTTTLSQLPQIQCWPQDGGAFITLPQVYSEDPFSPGLFKSNLGMYRIQISGNDYEADREVGIHYQLHRGLGIHHAHAIEAGKSLKISIFVGSHPAHALAAVMPLPEGLPEVMFAGMLAGRNFRYIRRDGYLISLDADFVITGELSLYDTKEEGPFGDHLGYYALKHPFPYLRVDKVYHRDDAVWPFTVVARPPQEDSQFGALIHRITKPVVSTEIKGVRALHAVDEAGVHPLLLASVKERYTPYEKEKKPLETMTASHAILGFGQCSLAKYLMVTADPSVDINDTQAVIYHILSTVDFRKDLHFITETTMDTLDYSSQALNHGSKLIIATNRDPQRSLSKDVPELPSLSPDQKIHCVSDGIFAVSLPPFQNYTQEPGWINEWLQKLDPKKLEHAGLFVLCDNAEFVAKDYANFLWVCFTRSNPSHDVYGVGSFSRFKHWGCIGPLVIDARMKPHMAPRVEDE
jgi:4-hydroxy-3-polyprenylbenzoate decarboxylase